MDVKVYVKGRKRKKRNTWRVEWTDPRTGKIKTKSAGYDKAYARQVASDLRRDLLTGLYREITTVSYDDFVTEHLGQIMGQLSRASYVEHERVLRQFKQACHPKDLTVIDFQMLEKFRKARLNDKTSPATINKGLRTLQSILERAVKRGYIKQNPFKGNRKALFVPESEPIVRTLESADFQKLLDRCLDDRWRAICTIGYYTGLRRSEILGLEWDDVDFDAQILHVRNKEDRPTKSRKNRAIPMAPQVISALRKLRPSVFQNVLVFKNMLSRQMKNNVTRDFVGIVVRAGLTDDQDKPIYTMHDLRRSCATGLLRNGVPARTVQKIMGHADLTTTMKYYVGVEDKDLRNAIAALATEMG